MRIDASGNVGIGDTTFAAGKLQVYDSAGNHVWLKGRASDGTSSVSFRNNSDSTYNGRIQVADTGGMQFAVGGTEHMRLSGGNLLVGTTSAAQDSGAGVKLIDDGTNGRVFVQGASQTSGEGYSLHANGAYRFYVSYSGAIASTSTSITGISDVSLKENIRDLDKGLETILALQPRRFDWKNGDGNDIMGFVAQEVETVLPELVHDYKYDSEETKLGLKMGDMVPSLVKAVQEQQAIIESQATAITDLTTRLTALENE